MTVEVCLDCGLAPGTLRCAAVVLDSTCNRPLCDQCAQPVDDGHFCHDHYRGRLKALEGLDRDAAKTEPDQGSLF